MDNQTYRTISHRVTEIVRLLAVAHALSGDRQTAHGLFRQSVPLILNRSANANIGDVSAEIRGIRLRLILESYLDFLTANSSSPLIRQTRIDAVGEAFLISQAIRAQSVQSAVSSSGARAAAGTPELADLVRREQDMKQQIVTLYGSLANAYSGGSDAAADTIRERIDVLLSAHSALLNEVNTRFPDYAEFTNPKPLTIAAVQNQLSAGQALVSFYAGEKTTYIWAVPKMGPVSFATSDGGRETLQVAIRELRRALLSACNTASANGRGAEAVSGLGRAFFYAGARSLLVSNWPVHSAATTELMTLTFRSLAKETGLTRAEALRRARIAMIDKGVYIVDGKAAFSYAHPIFWAPFTLVGDGGGTKAGRSNRPQSCNGNVRNRSRC